MATVASRDAAPQLARCRHELSTVAANATENKTAIREAGGVQLIIALFQTAPHRLDDNTKAVVPLAASALQNLVKRDETNRAPPPLQPWEVLPDGACPRSSLCPPSACT